MPEINQAFQNISQNYPKKTNHNILLRTTIIIGIILVLISTYLYFTLISPIGINKTTIEKPKLNPNSELESQHISYIVNEIGGFKLHNDPRNGQSSEIEFNIKNTDIYYTVKILDNIPATTTARASSPDLRITANKQQFIELINSEDITEKIVDLVSKGEIEIEVIADEASLALKGYKSIYDNIMKQSGLPTGQFVRDFRNNLIWT